MNRRRVLLAVMVFGSLSCSVEGETGSVIRAPIVNGVPLSDDASRLSPAVRLEFRAGAGLGSGTLISPNTVLTAAHVFAGEDVQQISVVRGNSAVATRIGATSTYTYPGWIRTPGSPLVPADLGIVKLNGILGKEAEFTNDLLDCECEKPQQVQCVSGVVQTVDGQGAFIDAKGDPFNLGVFDVQSDPKLRDAYMTSPWEVLYRRRYIPLFRSHPPAPTDGDSGMGCFSTATGKLVVVHSDATGGDHRVERNAGNGSEICKFCGRIKAYRRLGPPVMIQPLAFEIQADGDDKPDVVALTQVLGETFTLSIDRTLLGPQSFSVSIPNPRSFTAGTIGNFAGTGASLVVVEDGAIRTLAFNHGPSPNVSGASASDYFMIASARINGDSRDDLVAQHRDGSIDVFFGSPNGLALAQSVRAIPMRLDHDRLADFVWVNGGDLNVSTTLPNAVYRGSFFAKSLKVGPGTLLEFARPR